MSRELEIIQLVKKTFPSTPELPVRNGDDAAVLPPLLSHTAITCDSFIEDVHFKISETPPESIGYKAVIAAVSDIPAMGCRPQYILVSAGVPKYLDLDWIRHLLAGIRQASDACNVKVIGGDTTGSSTGLVLSVTALGGPWNSDAHILRQDSAQEHDAVFVSKPLGDSLAGFLIKEKEFGQTLREPHRTKLITAHDRPILDLQFSGWLASRADVTSCTDISDGLLQDLKKIGRASRIGFEVECEHLPFTESLQHFSKQTGISVVDLALQSGEEFGLLFTVSKDNVDKFTRDYLTRFGRTIQSLGKATGEDVQLTLDSKRYQCQFQYQFEH